MIIAPEQTLAELTLCRRSGVTECYIALLGPVAPATPAA
jgi:hypothetical protein